MEKGHFTILWSCSGFTSLQYLFHCAFLTSLFHVNCSSMYDTAIVTAPDCSVLLCRNWSVTASAKFSPVYVLLAGNFLGDKHVHGSWPLCFKRLRSGRQLVLSSCVSQPGGVAGTSPNIKAEGNYLEFHTLFGKKSASSPEVCLNPLYHEEPSHSRLLPWMLLCEFLQQGVKWRKMPQSICDCFSQQETIFGSLPRVTVNFWSQHWKHKAFVEDCQYVIPLFPFLLTQSVFNGIHARLKALVALGKPILQVHTLTV